jgi:hypothetical protein
MRLGRKDSKSNGEATTTSTGRKSIYSIFEERIGVGTGTGVLSIHSAYSE